MSSKHLVATGLILASIAIATPARADLVLGGGLSGSFGLSEDSIEMPSSWAASGLVGLQLDLGIRVTPELELIYGGSLGSLGEGGVRRSFLGMGGARVGFPLGNLVPSVYAHFGIGRLSLEQGEADASDTGPLVEAGGALDYQLTEDLSLGLQAGVTGARLSELASDDYSISWVRAGAHLKLYL